MGSNAIQHWTKEGWLPSNFYRSFTPSAGIFVAPGPSLDRIDVTKLLGPGKTVFGINTTYPKVRPDIWCGMDDPKCYNPLVFHEGITKVYRGGFQQYTIDGVKLKHLPNMHFMSLDEVSYAEKTKFFKYLNPDTEKLIYMKNVMVTTLNLMLHMGYKNIYLAGVDFCFDEKVYAEGTGADLRDYQKDWNKNLYDWLAKWLDWIADTLRFIDINIYSISPNSPINKFLPFLSIEDLNQQINLELPTFKSLVHCSEIKKPTSLVCSPEYQEILQKEHNKGKWGVTAESLIEDIKEIMVRYNVTEVLDYGCGAGGFKKALNDPTIQISEYDPGIQGKDTLPDPSDFVICIDVLEHIEPDKLKDVLKDLRRVTKGIGYFTISTIPAKRILSDGRNAHLIVEDFNWWMSKLKDFKIINSVEQPSSIFVEVM
tara:strand:- start:53 stop:1330 length:1278 start_codon:yes stop_codon:yes gene_type:complete